MPDRRSCVVRDHSCRPGLGRTSPGADDLVFAAGYVVIVGVDLPLVWRSEDRRRAREAEAAQEHPDVQVAPGSEIDPDATADT